MNSFDKMYAAFNIFFEASQNNKEKFYPLSAGVNWMDSNKAIIELLHLELNSALTYKNYGRSIGAKIVTDVIAHTEADLAESKLKPSIVICNGSAEGSYLIFEHLKSNGNIKNGDTALMLNHGFPLYNKLSEKFKLKFKECLCNVVNNDSLLVPIENIIEEINLHKPKIVFLIAPNNPIGEVYSKEALIKLESICDKLDIKIIIDRVCMLPWDNYRELSEVFMKSVIKGNTFIVDSFSKSESLAGIRTGYIVTNKSIAQNVLTIIQYRNLNPVVFSTLTLMLSKVLSLNIDKYSGYEEKYIRSMDTFIKKCLYDYPEDRSKEYFNHIVEQDLISRYYSETQKNQNVINSNLRALKNIFNESPLVKLNLDAGFNVALMLENMETKKEKLDVINMANKLNIGVLTESCFRKTRIKRKNYFIRIGLTIPENEFLNASEKLYNYFN